MVLLLAGLQSIPPTLYEAASVDGANAWQRFRSLTLPLMRPVSLSVLLLGIIYTFKVFDLIYVMTAGGPVDATTVLPIYAYDTHLRVLPLRQGAAAAALLLVGLIGVALAYLGGLRREEVGVMAAVAAARGAGLQLDAARHVLVVPSTSSRSSGWSRPRSSRAGHLRQPAATGSRPAEWDDLPRGRLRQPVVLKAIRSSVIISVGTMVLTLVLAAPAAYALAAAAAARRVVCPAAADLAAAAQHRHRRAALRPLQPDRPRQLLPGADPGRHDLITLPFAVIILRPFFLTRADGPGSRRAHRRQHAASGAFWRIVLPLVRPGLITVGVLRLPLEPGASSSSGSR